MLHDVTTLNVGGHTFGFTSNNNKIKIASTNVLGLRVKIDFMAFNLSTSIWHQKQVKTTLIRLTHVTGFQMLKFAPDRILDKMGFVNRAS